MSRYAASAICRRLRLIAVSIAATSSAASGAELIEAAVNQPKGFHSLDWLVLAAYGATLLAIGFYFYRRERTTEAYFTADRNLKPFMAGISLFATLLSTISYIAIPGEFVQNGPVFAVLYIAAMIALLGYSSSIYLWAQTRSRPLTDAQTLRVAAGFGASALLSVAIFVLSMRSGVKALEGMDQTPV